MIIGRRRGGQRAQGAAEGGTYLNGTRASLGLGRACLVTLRAQNGRELARGLARLVVVLARGAQAVERGAVGGGRARKVTLRRKHAAAHAQRDQR